MYPELEKAYLAAERRSQAFLDEKFLTLLVAMGAGGVFAILNHKLRPGLSVQCFCLAVLFFALAIFVTLWRIAQRPFTELFGMSTDLDFSAFVRRDRRLGYAFAIIVLLGLAAAAGGTLFEVYCYDRPAAERCGPRVL